MRRCLRGRGAHLIAIELGGGSVEACNNSVRPVGTSQKEVAEATHGTDSFRPWPIHRF